MTSFRFAFFLYLMKYFMLARIAMLDEFVANYFTLLAMMLKCSHDTSFRNQLKECTSVINSGRTTFDTGSLYYAGPR